MSFKQYLLINEWLYDDLSLHNNITNKIKELEQFIVTSNFYNAEMLLEKLWRMLFNQYKKAVAEEEIKEVALLKNILNRLDKINRTHVQLRNVATQRIE